MCTDFNNFSFSVLWLLWYIYTFFLTCFDSPQHCAKWCICRFRGVCRKWKKDIFLYKAHRLSALRSCVLNGFLKSHNTVQLVFNMVALSVCHPFNFSPIFFFFNFLFLTLSILARMGCWCVNYFSFLLVGHCLYMIIIIIILIIIKWALLALSNTQVWPCHYLQHFANTGQQKTLSCKHVCCLYFFGIAHENSRWHVLVWCHTDPKRHS